ncbi:MAG TPA: ABC transporter substrate-binding protein, partial [Clostridia bacterium]|nr:ABC transporter substrate-binding protein [Clostridia bacterium]
MKKRIAILLVLVMVLASFAAIATSCKKSTIIEGDYTYNDYMAGSPDTWNNHTWETSDDSYILAYTDVGLYNFQLNSTKDGYDIVPEMAAAAPVDVTNEYAGNDNFGVPANATAGYAWKIALNKDAVWQNGVQINADTYIYSMQQQLSQQMLNRRADSWYAGDLIIANAKNYLYSGQEAYSSLADKGFDSVEAAYAAGYTTVYCDFVNFWGGTGPDGEQYLPIDSDLIVDDGAEPFPASEIYNDYLAPGAPYESYIGDYLFVKDSTPVTTWDQVGLLKTGEYEITLVLQKPITQLFYVYYNLSGNWIVYEELYEACKQQSGDLIVSTYGTSVETTMSYGPYILSEFQADKQFTLTRNETWYGYWDGQHAGQY